MRSGKRREGPAAIYPPVYPEIEQFAYEKWRFCNGKACSLVAVGTIGGMSQDDWLIWQWIDSAFPAGGMNHSGGLEVAWQLGEIGQDVQAFVRTHLAQQGRSMLPMAVAVARTPAMFEEADARCEAMLTNHVANRASRVQGRALLSAAGRVFGADVTDALRTIDPTMRPVHQAPVMGAVGAALKLPVETVGRVVLFTAMRSVISAAVRLGIVGPFEGQSIQYGLRHDVQSIAKRCTSLPIEQACYVAPLMDVTGAMQDRLYSRLFVS